MKFHVFHGLKSPPQRAPRVQSFSGLVLSTEITELTEGNLGCGAVVFLDKITGLTGCSGGGLFHAMFRQAQQPARRREGKMDG